MSVWILEDHHDVEQGRAADVVIPLEVVDQRVERIGLVIECCGHGLADAVQQLDVRHAAGDLIAQRSMFTKKPTCRSRSR